MCNSERPPSSPATPPEKAADRSRASGTASDLETASKQTLGRIPKVKQPKEAPDPSSPAARLQKAAKRAKEEGDMTQAEQFAQAARDLEYSGDDEAVKGVLRKLAKAKTP